MRPKLLISLAVMIAVSMGGYIIFELTKPPLPYQATCEDEENICLFYKSLHLDEIYLDDGFITTQEDGALFAERMKLCSRMSDSSKKDECYYLIALSYEGDRGKRACSRITYNLRVLNRFAQKFVDICSLRDVEVLLAAHDARVTDDELFNRVMELCARRTPSRSGSDECYYSVALNFEGEKSQTACNMIPARSAGDQALTHSQRNCLKEIGAEP